MTNEHNSGQSVEQPASAAAAANAAVSANLRAVFWDMDGTLIDSEPLWHAGELEIAREHGGYWDLELARAGSGTPVPDVARRMQERGCPLSIEEIGEAMINYVTEKELESLPWMPGVTEVLAALRDAGVPSILVTTSPRHMAENLIAQAPANSFAGYVCGDDSVEKKPSPEPYLRAMELVGIDGLAHPVAAAHCVAIEDSESGLTAATASGATTLCQAGFLPDGKPVPSPEFGCLYGYDSSTLATIGDFVDRRLADLKSV
ncbi:HAD family hydrolase [Bifidobacterium choloepi]|uniref:HAD family phosphatase n=1 Tax=Bifidobacterium choloepi TaxID=2614131 RepID=A0A6I5NJI7_9BIFI|nr:HAD family phosphatase [Bifidobacterium choloepi]NEG70543.1 HAD family phosphatase [Bifidobacterium choloepi]